MYCMIFLFLYDEMFRKFLYEGIKNNSINLKAPELYLVRISIVDEEEVYRNFGGCLPVAQAQPTKLFFKTLG